MTPRADEHSDLNRLLTLLPRMALFNGVPQRAFSRILHEFELVTIRGGQTLMKRGEAGRDLYVITAGSIGMWVERDGDEQMVAQFVPGQTVGELAILSGEKRVGTLIALRDCELLRMSAEVFHEITERHPVIMENLSKLLVRRLHELMRGEKHISEWQSKPKTIAIVPVGDIGAGHDIGDQLGLALAKTGGRIRLLDHQAKDQATEWFYGIEAHHEHVIYVADRAHDSWTQLCLRQADRVLLVANGSELPPARHPLAEERRSVAHSIVELAIVHPAHADNPGNAVEWVASIKPDHYHNVRTGNANDVDRLARHLTGRANGLVLAGGGARGFAHLGVIRALREAGIPIDHVGGTSMGGIVAAGVALEWSDEELRERMHASFVEVNPLGRLTIPMVSLFRGRRIQMLLENNFGTTRIEEMWRPYFCVVSNLTTGKEIIERRGELWRALRASVAIPGIAPPVVKNNEVLVDGAVINNFPADIMSQMRRGPVIGVDVETHRAFNEPGEEWAHNPDWGILGESAHGGPNIISILMRSGTVNSEAQTKASRAHADLLFEPPVADIAIRDWKEFDRVIEAGYIHAAEKLESFDHSVFAG